MPYVPVQARTPEDWPQTAEQRWRAIRQAQPDLAPAIDLQRRLLTLVVGLADALKGGRLPRLSLPPGYLAAKLARGVPALAGEPVPLPVAVLTRVLLQLCTALGEGGAGEAADHIRQAIATGSLDAGSLLSASFARDQSSIRTGAGQRGLAPDLVWLVAELAVSPYVNALQRLLLTAAVDPRLRSTLEAWNRGYCPACGSWPAVAEVVGGHRLLRCSFCASAWELSAYACIYCEQGGDGFLTAAPDAERKDRRLEVCSACHGYLKSIDIEGLSPFPLAAISDIETTDLDVAAMERGYRRPALKPFTRR